MVATAVLEALFRERARHAIDWRAFEALRAQLAL